MFAIPLAQIETIQNTLDHVASKDDRYWFLGAIFLIISGCVYLIRYLFRELEAQRSAFEKQLEAQRTAYATQLEAQRTAFATQLESSQKAYNEFVNTSFKEHLTQTAQMSVCIQESNDVTRRTNDLLARISAKMDEKH